MEKLIAAAVSLFLPPLGVLIRRGVTGQFWVNLLLTLLGYLPGLIHALYHCLTETPPCDDNPSS